MTVDTNELREIAFRLNTDYATSVRIAADEIDRLRVERDAARADAEKWETRANEMGNKFSAASATARRDALNEAADEWQRSGVVPVADWLRARADGVSDAAPNMEGPDTMSIAAGDIVDIDE